MKALINLMRKQSGLVNDQRSTTRIGTVDAYDPNYYMAKVALQPEGTITGWLPLGSQFVGNGWGLFCAPSIGDMVEVEFEGDNIEAGICCHRFFNDIDRPLNVPSGEFWIVHKTGSLLKFHNDGSVEVETAGDLNATVGGQANLTVTGKVIASAQEVDITATAVNITGQLSVSGNILSAADIIDNTLFNSKTMAQMRGVYDAHVHPNVQSGPSNTGLPNPTI